MGITNEIRGHSSLHHTGSRHWHLRSLRTSHICRLSTCTLQNGNGICRCRNQHPCHLRHEGIMTKSSRESVAEGWWRTWTSSFIRDIGAVGDSIAFEVNIDANAGRLTLEVNSIHTARELLPTNRSQLVWLVWTVGVPVALPAVVYALFPIPTCKLRGTEEKQQSRNMSQTESFHEFSLTRIQPGRKCPVRRKHRDNWWHHHTTTTPAHTRRTRKDIWSGQGDTLGCRSHPRLLRLDSPSLTKN